MTQGELNTSYAYSGTYDKDTFSREYAVSFAHVDKFNEASIPDLVSVLSMIEADPRIIDLRWTAYMLATMLRETSHTVRVHGRHGHDKKVWRNFAPIEETGHGRGHGNAYPFPVKVKRLSGGNARVTEWTGGQWAVNAHTGKITDFLHIKHFRNRDLPMKSSTYIRDDGVPNQYFGRGYSQLTWWTGYVMAGSILNRGLHFLFNPELVLEPRIAYQIMATSMITGKGFANGHRFPQYFTNTQSDYVNARNMVNPRAKIEQKKEVADVAQRFEAILLASRINDTISLLRQH